MLLQLERKAVCWARKSTELLKEGQEAKFLLLFPLSRAEGKGEI